MRSTLGLSELFIRYRKPKLAAAYPLVEYSLIAGQLWLQGSDKRMTVRQFMLVMVLDLRRNFFLRERGCSGMQMSKSHYDRILEGHKKTTFTIEH